jgi:hypothetical protein
VKVCAYCLQPVYLKGGSYFHDVTLDSNPADPRQLATIARKVTDDVPGAVRVRFTQE